MCDHQKKRDLFCLTVVNLYMQSTTYGGSGKHFMTTRSGLSYKQEATTSIQELKQFLVADRKKREKEIAEERQQYKKDIEVEQKRSEEERDAREAESRKRLEEMQAHMTTLMKIVERTASQSSRG